MQDNVTFSLITFELKCHFQPTKAEEIYFSIIKIAQLEQNSCLSYEIGSAALENFLLSSRVCEKENFRISKCVIEISSLF
jgi:hypothetical protein